MGRKAVPLTARKCGECGVAFETNRDGRFCSRAHQSAFNARMKSEGAALAVVAKAWAMTRHAKPGTPEAEINKYARRELTTIASLFNEQDREAGRSVLNYVQMMMDAGTMYIDRKR